MPLNVGRVKKKLGPAGLFGPTDHIGDDEIAQAPRRITRSRSRECKGKVNFYKIETSTLSNRLTSESRSGESSKRGKSMKIKKTTTKKSNKPSKATQLEDSDSEWEDQPDKPQNLPATRLGRSGRGPRHNQQLQPPATDGDRSPIQHVASSAVPARPSRAIARLQAFRYLPRPRQSPTAVSTESTFSGESGTPRESKLQDPSVPANLIEFSSEEDELQKETEGVPLAEGEKSIEGPREARVDGETVRDFDIYATTGSGYNHVDSFNQIKLGLQEEGSSVKAKSTVDSGAVRSIFDLDSSDSFVESSHSKTSARKQGNQKRVNFQFPIDHNSLENQHSRENRAASAEGAGGSSQPGVDSQNPVRRPVDPTSPTVSNASYLSEDHDISIITNSQLSNITLRTHSRSVKSTKQLQLQISPSNSRFLTVDEQILQSIARVSINSPPPVPEPKLDPVVMPHRSENWTVIQDSLKSTCHDIISLKHSIIRYNGTKRFSMDFQGLDNYIRSLNPNELNDFFCRVLPSIKNLALQLPELLVERMDACQRQENSVTEITQKQAGCLLANGFLCTFPDAVDENEKFGGHFFNFSRLFEAHQHTGSDRHEINEIVKQKIQCIIAYFSEIKDQPLTNLLIMERVYIAAGPAWWNSNHPLRPVNIEKFTDSCEGVEVLNIDGVFGGDVFGFQVEEEQIHFLVHPELMIARLFVEPLEEDEALFFRGVRPYSLCEGFGKSFKYSGPSTDSTPRIFAYVGRTHIKDGEIYTKEDLIKELNKMFVVFRRVDSDDKVDKRVTVKVPRLHECRGDLAITFLIFFMVASYVGISGTFCICDKQSFEEIVAIQELLIRKQINIRSIFGALCEHEQKDKKRNLYFFLKTMFEKIES
ncbi:uncharacterized protein LOC135162148 [Diachasmimorpha longicaudata]|uniref:uncharacterized protein LOC135162148 n=1 Tax=Diachasmimorpha longicaudata TaxID=58733 RepID=UPI0030B8DC3A